MHILRRSQHLILAARLLATAVVLRSLIAPGFMLSVSRDAGLEIIFCNGPVAIHVPDSGHSDHHHDSTGKTGDQVHVTPLCGHWSSSSHFVATAFYDPSVNTPFPVGSNAIFPSAPVQTFIDGTRITRGPPSPV